MIIGSTDAADFEVLRPRLIALVEQHRTAATEEERSRLVERMEEVFLATAWHVAQDLLENGWKPARLGGRAPSRAPSHLRLVGRIDAA